MIDTVVLAAKLEHGAPRMYQRAKGLKVPVPSLAEEDLGDLVRFLNSAMEPEAALLSDR